MCRHAGGVWKGFSGREQWCGREKATKNQGVRSRRVCGGQRLAKRRLRENEKGLGCRGGVFGTEVDLEESWAVGYNRTLRSTKLGKSWVVRVEIVRVLVFTSGTEGQPVESGALALGPPPACCGTCILRFACTCNSFLERLLGNAQSLYTLKPESPYNIVTFGGKGTQSGQIRQAFS